MPNDPAMTQAPNSGTVSPQPPCHRYQVINLNAEMPANLVEPATESEVEAGHTSASVSTAPQQQPPTLEEQQAAVPAMF